MQEPEAPPPLIRPVSAAPRASQQAKNCLALVVAQGALAMVGLGTAPPAKAADGLPEGLNLPAGTRSLGVATGEVESPGRLMALVAWVPEAGGEPSMGLFRQEGGAWVEASRQEGLLSPLLEGLGLSVGQGGLAVRQALPGGLEAMARFAGPGLPLVAAAGRSAQNTWSWDAAQARFESQNALGKTHKLQELWAPPGNAWGPVLRLDAPAEGSPEDGRWAGARDASGTLRVRRAGADLELEAIVTDDRMMGGDALAMVLLGGERKALGQRKPIPGGWKVNAKVPLAQLVQPRVGGRAPNGDLLRQATFVVVDSDGPSPPTLLGNGPASGAYLGRVRLRAKATPPQWGSCTPAELDFEAGDPRP